MLLVPGKLVLPDPRGGHLEGLPPVPRGKIRFYFWTEHERLLWPMRCGVLLSGAVHEQPAA